MNAAQQLQAAIGVAVNDAPKQAHGNKNPSATKAGPGRYYDQTHTKDSPRKPRAGFGFVLRQATPAKKERRHLVKTYGRRQTLKLIKSWRAEQKAKG